MSAARAVEAAVQAFTQSAQKLSALEGALTAEQRRRLVHSVAQVEALVDSSRPLAASNDPAPAARRAKGAQQAPATQGLLEVQRGIAEGRLLAADQMQSQLGVSRQALSKARQTHRLFALTLGDALYYPSFFADLQFERRQLEAVSKALGDLPSMAKWLFFQAPKASLGGQTPLQALAVGQAARVVAAAQAAAGR